MSQDFRLFFELYSGFKVAVKPMCPYYVDFIEEVFPFKEHPKRVVQLAGGDTYEIPFEVDKKVSYTSEHEDYDLYIKTIAVDAYNKDLEPKRQKAREDFLLATAIEVLDGPIDFNDNKWIDEVEAAFAEKGYMAPTHEGALKVLFLKTQVITTPQERTAILDAALYREVSESELMRSLSKF